jgi:hypothetical protein
MRILAALIFIFVLAGCANNRHPLEQEFTQACLAEGHSAGSDTFKACMDSRWLERQKQINEAYRQVDARRAKAEKEMAAAQLKADKAQCKKYGLKSGTKDFANCLMNLETQRQMLAQQQQLQANRQQRLNALNESMKRQAYLKSLDTGLPTNGNMLARMGAAQNDADIRMQMQELGMDSSMYEPYKPTPTPKGPRSIHCDRTNLGIDCTEW